MIGDSLKNKIPYKILVILQRIKRLILTIHYRLKGFQVRTSYSHQLEDIYLLN